MYSNMLKKALEMNLEDVEDVAEMVFEYLKEKDECKYWKMFFKLHEATYGHKLNEEMAEEWVESMKPYGEHWDMEQTNSVRMTYGVNVDEIDFYTGMNMMYNDYSKAIEYEGNMTEEEKLKAYIKLTEMFINDEDFKGNKMYEYYKMVVFNNIKRAY